MLATSRAADDIITESISIFVHYYYLLFYRLDRVYIVPHRPLSMPFTSRVLFGLICVYRFLNTQASTIPRVRITKPMSIQTIGLPIQNVQCILSDIDGTLVSHRRRLDDRTYSTIKDAISKGYLFFPCTGRTRKSAAAVLGSKFVSLYGKSANEMPGVYQQGLSVYGPQGQLIYRNELEINTLRELINLCDQYHVSVLGYADDSSYCKEFSPEIQKIIESSDPIPIEVGKSLSKLYRSNIHIQKLILVDNNGSLDKLIPQLVTQFRGRIDMLRFSSGMLEILPFAACKGHGASILLQHMNISPSKVIAFGDGINDVEMLRMVKYGIAMGNGHKSLMAQASFMTNTVDECGVAEVLDNLVKRMCV